MTSRRPAGLLPPLSPLAVIKRHVGNHRLYRLAALAHFNVDLTKLGACPC